MFSRSKKTKVSGHVETLIGKGTRVEGNVVFSGGLHLDGKVEGNVHADPGTATTLWISEQGAVEGLVDVPHVVLNGKVLGDIHARERIVMGAKARVTGNVYYGVMEMSQGAEVSGKLVPTSTAAGGQQALISGTVSGPQGVKIDADGIDADGPASVTNFDARRTRS